MSDGSRGRHGGAMFRREQHQFEVLRLPEQSPVPGLLRRVSLAVALVLLTTALMWFTRDGLSDNGHPNRVMTFVDVFYFTVVSLATVGYGDIAPVSPSARLLNALLLTPIRVFVWVIFLGTAYELTFQRYREQVQMSKLKKKLRGHTILCGFGVKGRAIVRELLALGHTVEQILVIEPDDAAIQEATSMGLVALRGDASSEQLLLDAGIEEAAHVVAAPNRDDTCVLICLTVRSLSPHVRLIAAAREAENIKLLYKAGADVVVAPSVAAGRLMGAAVENRSVTSFLQDLLTHGRGEDVGERFVASNEEGSTVADLIDQQSNLVLGVARGDERVPFVECRNLKLKQGDVIVYVKPSANHRNAV